MNQPKVTLEGDYLLIQPTDKEEVRIRVNNVPSLLGQTDVMWMKFNGDQFIRGDQYVSDPIRQKHDTDYAIDILPIERLMDDPRKWDNTEQASGNVMDEIDAYSGQLIWCRDTGPNIQ